MINQGELDNCYFIYHAPKLQKVGITKRLKKRLRDQKLTLGKDAHVIATVSLTLGPKVAGDVEFLLAKSFNYVLGTHYYDDR